MSEIPKGYVMPTHQCGNSRKRGIWDRLDTDWQPITAEELDSRLRAASLVGDLWKLTSWASLVQHSVRVKYSLTHYSNGATVMGVRQKAAYV